MKEFRSFKTQHATAEQLAAAVPRIVHGFDEVLGFLDALAEGQDFGGEAGIRRAAHQHARFLRPLRTGVMQVLEAARENAPQPECRRA